MKQTIVVSCALFVLSACGVSGDKIFSANAHPDIYQINGDAAEAQVLDVVANDGGSGAIILDVTQGYHGSVSIGSGEFTVEYEPNSVSNDTYFADWFEYRIRSNNYKESVSRVAVRFSQFASDRYEPDDFQEYARPLNLRLGIPYVEDHSSDIANPIPTSSDTFLSTNQTIGGDEDWFQVTVPAATDAAMRTWLRIETLLPNKTGAEHNALIITAMDQWGFVARDTLGLNLVERAGSGLGSNDASGQSDATTLDRAWTPGTYLIRINPELGHAGPYTVRFTLYEAAPPILAPPTVISLNPKPYNNNNLGIGM